MRTAYHNMLLAAIAAFCAAGASAQTSAPSYDDTVHYIQERLALGLEQTGRCSFTWHNDYGWHFNAADLSPHVSWSTAGGSTAGGSINCAGGANCVHGSYDGGPRNMAEWDFSVKSDTDKSKMEKALLHLLDLCGVRPAKPDLFDKD
jgi:hypothetical protein